MRVLGLSSLAAFLAAATPGAALDFGNGFQLTGDVELEYFSSDDFDGSAGFADLTLSWRSQGGAGLSYGFDLTVDTIQNFEEDTSFTNVWGGLVVGTGFGEFTLGNPRPLLDTLGNAPDLGAARLLSLETGLFTGSLIAFTMFVESDVDIYGASFRGDAGALGYGLSYHRLEGEGEEVDAFEAVATYEINQALLYAGFESQENSGGDGITKLTLGARYDADRFFLGGELNDLDSDGGTEVSALELFGGYRVNDSLEVGAQFLDVSGSSDGQILGISGAYGFATGGFAELGYLHQLDDDEDAFSASVGFRF